MSFWSGYTGLLAACHSFYMHCSRGYAALQRMPEQHDVLVQDDPFLTRLLYKVLAMLPKVSTACRSTICKLYAVQTKQRRG